MSLLAPLYFLGALAIGLPVLFHLIRRRPKGEVEFSSLMFLNPTPPRLTRRSRLENIPLLLIRALALILLAAAFARPFLRQAAQSDVDAVTRRIVLAIDTSASMRRADLWRQAKAFAGEVIGDLRRGDRLAIVGFDDRPVVLLGFDQSTQLTPDQLKTAANQVIGEITPTWRMSDLGRAISYSADLAVTHEEDDQVRDDSDPSATITHMGPSHLVLITDMQAGSKIESLQVYAWPDELSLDVRKVDTVKKTNAWATMMVSPDGVPGDQNRAERIRVRVGNTSDADNSQFRLSWKSSDGSLIPESELPVQVPPGESRVVSMPVPFSDASAITVLDDDHSFDNDLFVVNRDPVMQKLLYVGKDADESSQMDPKDSLFYYLRRVPLSHRRRHVDVETLNGDWPAGLDPKQVPLVTIATGVSAEWSDRIKDYLRRGGHVLFVFATKDETTEVLDSIRQLTGAKELLAKEATVDDYVMLSRIKFSDPVFRAMADPQFNDFTKVRFWQHRKLTGVPPQWNVLASFDDGDPALVDVQLEEKEFKGKLWILTTGWQPKASQLALSTKFIPLVFRWFDASATDDRRGSSYVIGQTIDERPSSTAKITGPDGSSWGYQSSEDLKGIDEPGVYRFDDGNESRRFAMNVAESESNTESLDDDALERFGIKLGAAPTAQQLQDAGRQLRDIELEGRQKLWQWLLVVGLGMLLLESWLGGRVSRRVQTADV